MSNASSRSTNARIAAGVHNLNVRANAPPLGTDVRGTAPDWQTSGNAYQGVVIVCWRCWACPVANSSGVTLPFPSVSKLPNAGALPALRIG